MTHKVGIKGQVVIPKAIRDEIGIKPGDEIRALRGIWAGVGGGTEELLEERRRERDAEERFAAGQATARPNQLPGR